MWPPDFEPCHDLSPAEWLRPRLLPWGSGTGTPVTSIVPVGYDAYVRVFHTVGAPAPAETVTWQEVADWSGCVFHPLAQFERMSIPMRPNPGPPPFDQAPFQGDLTPALCDVLVRQLAGLTETPAFCHFAIWDGAGILVGGRSSARFSSRRPLGWLSRPSRGWWNRRSRLRAVGHAVERPGIGDGEDTAWHEEVARLRALDAEVAAWQEEVARLPRFEHPGRSYLLGRGPIGVAGELDRQPLAPDSWQTLGLTPQLWWPEDRAWVVATEIDFDSTIVATTNAGAEALLTCEELEALQVPPDGRLDLDGDEINLPY
ncbi:MAG: hypothetical protein ABSA65_01620 [Acidimicrobiales bacterium]|jgi:hypothetical protein